jgi:hypothetical protein
MPNTTTSKLPLLPRSAGRMSCSTCFASVMTSGADYGAPHAARTADHGHEQVLDALVDAEWRGVHEALQVRVEPPRHGREQRRVDEHDDLEPCGVDAERLGHFEVTAQRTNGAARTGIEQVARRPQRDERETPDQEIVVTLVPKFEAEETERRNAGETRMAAQELEIAKEEREADAPGDRREGKVVAPSSAA